MTTTTPTRKPHPIADIICAWANGFRVEFRYQHRDHNEDSETVYRSDEKWYLCGKHYSAFSSVNEHRIHADDLAAWEAFKRSPSLTVGDERGLALWQLIYGAIAHEPLPLKVGQIERAAKRVEDMLKRRAAAQAEPVAVKALGAEIAHEHDEALAELAAKAEAQFQADIRDAARYRVLRDKQYSFGPRITDPANVWLTYTPEGLDQACDEMLTFEAGSNPPAQGKKQQP
ncbi:MAG: hypothetical protein EKK53_21510 [Burkholderiales bacterium]|nr:MAG: hypothetical protein EKK53_21510 [Burkholderiales bacterium]